MTLSSEISTTSKFTEKSFLAFANNCHQSKAGTALASQLLLLFSHSVASNSLPPHGLQHTRLPSFTTSQSLLELMSIESVMPSSHLILCCPLLLLPSIFPSIRVFSNESAFHIRWSKY